MNDTETEHRRYLSSCKQCDWNDVMKEGGWIECPECESCDVNIASISDDDAAKMVRLMHLKAETQADIQALRNQIRTELNHAK